MVAQPIGGRNADADLFIAGFVNVIWIVIHRVGFEIIISHQSHSIQGATLTV